jgi:hypothetical protein
MPWVPATGSTYHELILGILCLHHRDTEGLRELDVVFHLHHTRIQNKLVNNIVYPVATLHAAQLTHQGKFTPC